MKKYLPYMLIGVVAAAAGTLFFTGEKRMNRRFDERITLRPGDKNPYGSYVAFESLNRLFPKAKVSFNKKEPGYWDLVNSIGERQALFIFLLYFNAREHEMKNLLAFIENGNDVFISATKFSYDALQFIKCDISASESAMYYSEQTVDADSLFVTLAKPPFDREISYGYPGKMYDYYFYNLDTATTSVLGYDKNNKPNFIHLKAGKGNLYVHLAPLTLSNYFLMHRNNISYAEHIFSVLSPGTKKLVWDDYFRTKKENREKQKNWLIVFFNYPALKWALLTALSALLIYVLSEMRRKQRIIPVVKKPKNDSLEFVKTIGHLYHDKSDHKNLCKKMASYFLEHIRSRYKLSTSELNDVFIANLQSKTGIPASELKEIVYFIKLLNSAEVINEKQLATFYKQLESFYKKV